LQKLHNQIWTEIRNFDQEDVAKVFLLRAEGPLVAKKEEKKPSLKLRRRRKILFAPRDGAIRREKRKKSTRL